MSVSISGLGRANEPKKRAPVARRHRPARRPGAHRAQKSKDLADLRVRILAARRQVARVIASL